MIKERELRSIAVEKEEDSEVEIEHRRGSSAMGFLMTTAIFFAAGLIASIIVPICCNRGAPTNLLHLTLIMTATVCCWMMWAIVYLAQLKPLIVPILSEGE